MTLPTSPNIHQVPPPSLAELSRRATVDKTDLSKYSIRSWIAAVNKLYEQGDFEYKRHSYDTAYVHYMKGCSIMVEVIAKHQNYKEAKKDPIYRQLKARTGDDILVLLEELATKLQQRDVENQRDDILQDAMNKYPPVDVLDSVSSPIMNNETQINNDSSFLLDGLPSVPTHAPDKSSPSAPVTRKTRQSSPKFMKMPEPESNPLSNIPPLPKINNNNNNNGLFQLPKPSNFPFPSTLVVDPKTLATWIVKKNGVEQTPNLLILDVRPRYVFDQGFIKHKWIAQIEPLVLKQDVQSKKIEESMVMNPEAEQLIFAGRNQFDLIVYYDQNSQSLLDEKNSALGYLRQAIYELEFQKTLQRAPMMLAGGFDAWRSVIGEKGIFKYKSSVSDDQQNNASGSPSYQQQNNNNHWLHPVMADQSPKYTPVKVHHTVYDYFSHAGSSGNKESMSRYSNRNHVETLPLQGVFSNTLNNNNNQSSYIPPISMPMPQPFAPAKTPDVESFSTKYPDIRPNTSTIQRKKTFIDNPFHGFTTTTNQQFDGPPLQPKPTRPLPSAPSQEDIAVTNKENVPPLPPKPANMYDVHTSSPPSTHTYRTAPVSDNSFSQVGNVMIGTTGLKNLGNTCFMNSIIQCLSGTIPFARYFLSGIFKQHINKDNFLGTGGALANAFATLIRTMWSENYNFISPVPFRQALIKFAPQFEGKEQHDSQEFLNFLLDGLHEDCNLIIKRPAPPPESAEEEARFEKLPDWQASGVAWERYLERNSSVVVSLFQGQYKSKLTCLTCHTTSTTYNSFMSLSLPIPANKSGPASVSLYQCLDYFVKEEVLEKSDAWNCPKCKKLRTASKQLTLSKLPDVLLIHLKRFSFDGPFKDKLETIVDSPMTGLDLSRYVPRSMFPPDQPPERSAFCYDLYAVSNHFGSLTGGHYTACVRNGYRNEWHNFDDSRFSVCDQSKVLSRAAYNLFYVRSSVK